MSYFHACGEWLVFANVFPSLAAKRASTVANYGFNVAFGFVDSSVIGIWFANARAMVAGWRRVLSLHWFGNRS